MTSLDPTYVLAPSLEMYFVDKDTGLPLSNGVVTFYRDIARTELKPVYKLSGTAPNYSYTALPNPCILSAVGTFQDDTGADILPYYHPYNADGTIDLYYITVTSQSPDLIPQFTREAWPNLSSTGPDANSEFVNFIPNSQFWPHNTNFPETSTITNPITDVAYGGWTFNRSTGSTAVDKVTFTRIGSAVNNPSGNPRYAIEIENVTPGGEAFKDLRVTFKDVNTFSSSSQEYTFSIAGQSQTAGSVPVQLYVIKNFGTGGDTQTETLIASYLFTGTYSTVQSSFVFGSNIGKVIGTLDDDYVALALRFPTGASFKVDFTDAILTIGAVTITEFPPTTIEDMNLRSIFGEVTTPAYDGSDLYLPVILTQHGVTFDRSQIGMIYATPRNSSVVFPGEAACNGQKFIRTKHSPEGIPYSRLHDVLLEAANIDPRSASIPLYGTGLDYSTANSFAPTQFCIANNSAGLTTVSSAGTSGFTVTTSHTGVATYYSSAYNISPGFFYLINSSIVTATPQTSGFSIGVARETFTNGVQPFKVTQIGTVAAAGLAGKYFNFNAYNSGQVLYYVWYQVDGSGADPAPAGRTGILVQLNSEDPEWFVSEKTRLAINGFQLSNVKVTVLPAASTYFTFNSTGAGYYVWFKVDNVGTDPAVAGRTGIEVDLLSTDTVAQAIDKIGIAINLYSYAVPDLRGQFIRGAAADTGFSQDFGARYSIVPFVYGSGAGTDEIFSVQQHEHALTAFISEAFFGAGGDHGVNFASSAINTDAYGDSETRPENVSLNYVIKI